MMPPPPVPPRTRHADAGLPFRDERDLADATGGPLRMVALLAPERPDFAIVTP
jgi:hypothetical protein